MILILLLIVIAIGDSTAKKIAVEVRGLKREVEELRQDYEAELLFMKMKEEKTSSLMSDKI
jgi:hypothetical protein